MKFTKEGKLEIVASTTSSKDDFDFLFGKWQVENAKRQNFMGEDEHWNKFAAKSETTQVLFGIGNIEKYTALLDGKPFEGCAVRLFDPITRLWSIHWADSNNGVLDPAVVGSFKDQVGDFYTTDLYKGESVIVRFNWNATDPDKPIWSQAFSFDQGQQWMWNWYMHFSREMDEE